MTKHVLLAVLAAALTGSMSCQRKTDFLYVTPAPKHYDFEHKLKEMTGNSEIDILWVIDNSGSMGQHQQTVIQNTDRFIDGMVLNTTLRWKMGLISTSVESPYVGFSAGDLMDSSMPNGAQRFKTAVRRLGTGGDVTEATFEPVMQAFTDYPTFLRPGAMLAIIVVSDAPEQSRMSAQTFIKDLTALKGGDASKILFYGFLNPTDWCDPTDDDWDWKNSPFEEVTLAFKGGTGKLCDPQFGANLATLGTDIGKLVTTPKIILEEQPIVSSLKVMHGNREIPGGFPGPGNYWHYVYNYNAVLFSDLSFAPNDNESVRVIYDVDTGAD